jgi:CHAD domain-containing protein
MTFRLDPARPLGAAAHDVLVDQLARLRRDLDRPDPDDAVHRFRRRSKKVRALVRLLRSGLADAKTLDRAARDAARELAALRDSRVLADTARGVARDAEDPIVADAADRVADALATRHRERIAAGGFTEARTRVLGHLQRLETALGAWSFAPARPRKEKRVLRRALERARRRGRPGLKALAGSGHPEALHALRKRVKDLRYQVHLLRETWPRPLGALEDAFDELGEALGDDHDLHVLAEALAAPDAPELEPQRRAALLQALEDARRGLQASALGDARRLFVERDRDFGRRLGRYWRLARG